MRALRLSSRAMSAFCALARVAVVRPSAMRARLLRALRAAGLDHLAAQALDLLGERLVLVHLAAQPADRDARLLLEAGRREVVHVGGLVLAVAEVARLEQALLHQGADAEVDLAQADPQRIGQLTLAQCRVFFQ